MSGSETPTPSSNLKKRNLSSPFDSLDSKKNKVRTESSDSDSSYSLPLESSESAMTNITLSEADIGSIAKVLNSTFETKFEANIETLVKK